MGNEVEATNAVAAATADISAQACDVFNREVSRGQEFIEQAWSWLMDKGVEFAINLVVALLILLVGGIVVKAITAVVRKALHKALEKTSAKSGNANDGLLLENFLCSVVSKVGWIFLLVLALGRIGINMGPIIAGLGVTGFIFGFAFKDTLANFASGIMIAINRPFSVGDYVIVAGVEGAVVELNMMATVIATADNKRITVPNNSVWGGPVTNFSAMATRRVDLAVGVGYGQDLDKAKKVVLEALRAMPLVLAEPAPMVEVASFDDSEIALTVRVWCKNADYWSVFFAGNRTIADAFEKAGIEVPFPQIDVHMKND